jgi:hypothetical protein
MSTTNKITVITESDKSFIVQANTLPSPDWQCVHSNQKKIDAQIYKQLQIFDNNTLEYYSKKIMSCNLYGYATMNTSRPLHLQSSVYQLKRNGYKYYATRGMGCDEPRVKISWTPGWKKESNSKICVIM